MRIRKRQQLPLSVSSDSVSDPILNRSPVVQLQLQLKGNISPSKNLFHGADSPNPGPDNINASKKEAVEDDEEEKCNDSWERRSMFGAETRNGFLLESSSSSSQVVGRWCEREKAFPLKKRRGNFEKWEKEEMDNNVDLSEKNEKKTMKTKMNKKCIDNDRGNNGGDGGRGGKKRSRSGGALMEGSRCSRVNGRGWRCCQQTLVGYSLCEHHLGKGRLRSMNSVRNRSSAASIALKKESPPLEDDDDVNKPFTSATTKKRMKLGVVKARSISSLLGQIDNVGAVTVVAPPRLEDNINK